MSTTPSDLGIAGKLTRSFIVSPLTPLFLLAAFAFGLVALMTLCARGRAGLILTVAMSKSCFSAAGPQEPRSG